MAANKAPTMKIKRLHFHTAKVVQVANARFNIARMYRRHFLPCSSGSTILDIIALMVGVGMPPRQATNGTRKKRNAVMQSVT